MSALVTLGTDQGEFVVDEANVERRVMDDQLRAFDELEELVGDLVAKRGLPTRNSLVMPWTPMAPSSLSRSGCR
jgi:hypothetical protein